MPGIYAASKVTLKNVQAVTSFNRGSQNERVESLLLWHDIKIDLINIMYVFDGGRLFAFFQSVETIFGTRNHVV